MRDPKNSFYKYLNLDPDTMKIIKWYRKISKDLLNDKCSEIVQPIEDDEDGD